MTYRDAATAKFVSTLIHIIDGKKVDCKKARPRETPVDPFAADPNFKTSKIFVGGLPSDLSKAALRDYFMQYGVVVDCVIVSDKETKQSRCFGFVQFTTCQAVEKVMKNYYNIIIHGKWVECKKALPRERCTQLLKSNPRTNDPLGLGSRNKNNVNSLPVPMDLYKVEERQDVGGQDPGMGDYYQRIGLQQHHPEQPHHHANYDVNLRLIFQNPHMSHNGPPNIHLNPNYPPINDNYIKHERGQILMDQNNLPDLHGQQLPPQGIAHQIQQVVYDQPLPLQQRQQNWGYQGGQQTPQIKGEHIPQNEPPKLAGLQKIGKPRP